jgi:hypothetical protein
MEGADVAMALSVVLVQSLASAELHPSTGCFRVAAALAAAAVPALSALALLHRSPVASVSVFPVLLAAALLADRLLVLWAGLTLSLPVRRITTVLSLAVLGNLYVACFHASWRQAVALLAAVGASVCWPRLAAVGASVCWPRVGGPRDGWLGWPSGAEYIHGKRPANDSPRASP